MAEPVEPPTSSESMPPRERPPGQGARTAGMALVALAIAAGGFFLVRSFQRPAGQAENVAEAPAGGRTQAQPETRSTDPLVPGRPEEPDVPADEIHAGVPKAGVAIREAVLADGRVGDNEVPGFDLTGLTSEQRLWVLDQAVAQTCSCGCRQDLLECRRDDASCPVSPARADSLVAAARQR